MATIGTIHRMLDNERMEVKMAQHRTSITSVMSWIGTHFERRRGRRLLLEMSDEQLKDIGISRADAYREGNRAMWI